jgi:hypothetical protein
MSLPFDVDSSIGGDTSMGGGLLIGNGIVWDASTLATRQPVVVSLRTSSVVQFGIRMNSGLSNRNVDSGGPITWAIDDGVTFAARYKRIP